MGQNPVASFQKQVHQSISCYRGQEHGKPDHDELGGSMACAFAAKNKNMNPDYKAAIDFLKRIQPLGPWCLCYQKPDKSNAFSGVRFSPEQADDCERWIAEKNSAG